LHVKRAVLALSLSCLTLQPAFAGCFEGFISPEIEAAAISESDGMVHRAGSRLHLQTKSGDIVLDDTDCEESAEHCIGYTFFGLSPDRTYYVLELRHYEGRTGALVDTRDGTMTQLAGVPNWSPVGDRLFSAFYDTHFSGTVFEIWHVAGQVQREYLLEPEEPVTYCVDRWLGSEKIFLKKTIWASKPEMEFGPEFALTVAEARLEFVNGDWILSSGD